MNAIGKIGVILPEIMDSLNFELLDGIHYQAKQLGYDVLVFTGVFNSQLEFQYDSHIMGLENVYELICRSRLDGILYAADIFNNAKVKQRIYDLMHMTDVPCLILGEENRGFPSLFTPQRASMKLITEHLIKEHGCRKLYCMTGFRGHYDSVERLAGFREAMDGAGLYWDQSCIFYGNFWKEEPRKLAEKIANGEVERPDAVVCASDIMAAALCDALAEYGISVPEEIAVTGYDGGFETSSGSGMRITTICGRYRQLGIMAVERFHRILGGSIEETAESSQRIRYGTSCGCSCMVHAKPDTERGDYIGQKFARIMEQKKYIASNLIYRLSGASDLNELITRIDRYACILPKWQTLDLCLCSDWMFDFENPEHYRQQGFSDTMHLALSKRHPVNEPDQYDFPTEILLPALQKPHEPTLHIFTSLHCEGQIFGYLATSYPDADAVCIDEYYVNWVDAVCNGLLTLQRKLYHDYQKQQLELMSMHDPATGLYNKKGLLECMPEFIQRCSAQQKTPFLLMLSNVCRGDATAKLGIDESLIIANALRLSAGNEEVYGRLSDHVFAVLLSAESKEECRKLTENRILALECKIQYIQGNVASMQMPELISDNCSITCDENRAEAMMEQHLIRITEKAAAAASRFQDYREQLQMLRREIYLDPQKDWSVATVLHRISISRSHFHRLYREQFTVSYMDDLIQARVEKAQQLLMYTNMRIQEIAQQCGYSNESHFMRQFKDRCGITPSRFRKDSE